jgi:hypothetical protein
MMDQPKPNADDPRDAHLLAALRHAPDRDVAPPARVTAAILAQAQDAVHRPRAQPAKASAGWRAIWAQLWQPAPMAAFGTVAMATLIGVLWGGKDLPETTPTWRPESATETPAPAAVPAPPAAAAPIPPATANRAAAPTAKAALPGDETSVPSVKSPARAKPDVGQVMRQPKESLRQAPPESEDKATADKATAGKLAESPATLPRLAAPNAPPPEASPQAPLPPAASPVQPPPAVMAQEPMAAAPEARRDALAKSMADAAASPARARSEQAALGAATSAIASPVARATADLDAALASDAARARWRTAAGRLVAHGSAQRDWWSALSRATEGRWQRVQAADARASGAAGAANLVLLIDGVAYGSLAFEPQAVVWRDANRGTWRAPLDAATLREWQEALARW